MLLGGWAQGGSRNPVAAGALAYFKWLNARGGVYGRKMVYRVLDDHGSARIVPSLMHRLVQGDSVFAVFGAQGAQSKAVTSFLDLAGVPDVFAGWGCGCLDAPATMPQVFGWPVTDGREGAILGGYLAQHYQGQKVAVVYSPDAAGRDGLAGFKAAAHGVKIAVRIATASPSGAAAAVASARAARAQVVVALTAPAVTAGLSAAMSSAHWHVPLVAAGSGIGARLPDGVITDGFLPSANAPASSAAGSWMTLFGKIRARYLPKTPVSAALIDGMSAAYELATAMFRAGPALTRPALIAAMNGLPPGPAAAPLAYDTTSHGGPLGAYIGTISNGVLMPSTGALLTDPSKAGTITAYNSPLQRAPADGLPEH